VPKWKYKLKVKTVQRLAEVQMDGQKFVCVYAAVRVCVCCWMWMSPQKFFEYEARF